MHTRICRTNRFEAGLRFAAVLGLMAITVALGAEVVLAQTPAGKIAEEVSKTLTTKDNVEIRITYYPGTGGQDSPVVVMLPGKGGSRLIYNNAPQGGKPLAKGLQELGYAVVTVDPRGHGESSGGPGSAAGKKARDLTARDYQAIVAFDLETVKKFLFEEHQQKKLNMAKLAIVAADVMTPVAVEYTLLDWSKTPYDDSETPAQRTPRGQDVKCLVLLTPDTTTPGMSMSAVGAKLRLLPVAVMMAVGTKDNANLTTANKLFDQLVPKKQEVETVFLQKYDGKYRGTDLLYKRLNPPVESHMASFLDKFLKQLNIDWRDRQSSLFKN
jgi:hypothetical protein